VLGLFLLADYPAAAPSVLPLSADEQYRVQIWYQAPLFVFNTLIAAWVLVALARAAKGQATFRNALVGLLFASTVPFLFTMLLVELACAILLLAGAVEPAPLLDWLKGDGVWFASTYQAIGYAWVAVLFCISAKRTASLNWPPGIAIGLATLAVYSIPIALLIR
jgi:hypothetical protein